MAYLGLRFKSFCCLLVILLFSCSKETTLIPSNSSARSPQFHQSIAVVGLQPIMTPSKFKVVGYLTPWEGDLNQLQYNKLTNINYAFVIPTLTGGLNPIDSISRLIALVSLAHSKNVKVSISIGGWNNGDDSGFISLSANASYRTNFVNNLLTIVNKYNLDGVDIDWETPNTSTQNNYTLLMNQLAAALHNKSKLLSAAVGPNNASYIQSEIFGYVDFFNIMAYDSFDNPNHSTYQLAVNALSYWQNRGLPSDKAILGVPFYGRTSKNYAFTSYVNYSEILAIGGNPYEDFLGSLGYNGINTIQEKTSLALKNAGGIMIWELGADAEGQYSLLTAINNVISTEKDSTVSIQSVQY